MSKLSNIIPVSFKEIFNFVVPIDQIIIHKNGKYLLFTAEVYLFCPNLECTSKTDKERNEIKILNYTELRIREWDEWKQRLSLFYSFSH